jgi:glucuronyl/N-acetylglucosaminyl transferase EXT2
MTAARVKFQRILLFPRYKLFYIILFCAILLGLIIVGFLQFWPRSSNQDLASIFRQTLENPALIKDVIIRKDSARTNFVQYDCTFHTCFDIYHCGYNDDNQITIYIYPLSRYEDENGVSVTLSLSKEFYEILETIADSGYHTNDPDQACLFIPSVDLLNQNNLRKEEIGQVLASLHR